MVNGIYKNHSFQNHMQVKIDKAGRVILPKAVRDSHGLTGGTLLDLDSTEDTIVLRRVPEKPLVRMKDGVLVVSAEPVGDIEDAVARERDTRSEAILGPMTATGGGGGK